MAFRFIDANEMNYFKIVKLSKNSRRMTCKFREGENTQKPSSEIYLVFQQKIRVVTSIILTSISRDVFVSRRSK